MEVCPKCGNSQGPFKVRRRVMESYTWQLFDDGQVSRSMSEVEMIEGEPTILTCECGKEWAVTPQVERRE